MGFFGSILNILRFNKRNWKAVMLCVLTASVFWCFNALNKRYTTTLSFPVQFDFDRERFIPVRPLPGEVRINVTGIGWNLLRRSTGVRVIPLIIPLDRPSEVRKIVGSTLPGLFSTQLGGFDINFILTDTLHLTVERKGSRLLRLEPNIVEILFKEGYALTSPLTITPDTVRLKGPLSLLRSLPNPLPVRIPQRNIDDDFHEPIRLTFLNDELIYRNPETVEVSFRVDKLVEITDSVRLAVRNAPKNSWPFIERQKLPCKIAVPERSLGSLKMDSVRAVIDLTGFKRGVKKVMPRLTGLPAYSRVISIDSVTIKF
ncbi:MAG TPA: hypothetical protein VK658_16440 [Chryseolinea sp.]|nr:hypothetical protein [Chryseolinea sp.]